MSDETQEDIKRYNRTEAWRDVANHLRVAEESIETAIGALDDIGKGAIGVAPMLELLPGIRARVERMRRNAEAGVSGL